MRLKALESDDLTVDPAKLEGGAANNVVPDHAVLRFNIRPKSTAAMEEFDLNLKHLISIIEAEHQVSIHRHGGVTRPPKKVDARAQALFDLVRQCGAELGQDIRWQSSGGVCDGNNIAACGVPVVDTMGVCGGAIHSPDEYLIVPSLTTRAALSARVIERLAQGALNQGTPALSFRLRAARPADLEALYEMAKLHRRGVHQPAAGSCGIERQAGARRGSLCPRR